MDPYVELRNNLEIMKSAIREQRNTPLAQNIISNYIKDLTKLTKTHLQDLQASDSCIGSEVHVNSPAVPMAVDGIACLEEFLQGAQGNLQSNVTGGGSPDRKSKEESDENQSTTSSGKQRRTLELPNMAVVESVAQATENDSTKTCYKSSKSAREVNQKHIGNRGKRRWKSVNTTVDESIKKDKTKLSDKRDIKGYSSDFFPSDLSTPRLHSDEHGTASSEVAGLICSGLDSVSTCSSLSLPETNFSDQISKTATQHRVDKIIPVNNPADLLIKNDLTPGMKSSPFKRNLNLSPIEHENAEPVPYCEEPKRKVRGRPSGKIRHKTVNQSCDIKRVCESKTYIAEKTSKIRKNDIAVHVPSRACASSHVESTVGTNVPIPCVERDKPAAVKMSTACSSLVNIRGVLDVMNNITSIFESSHIKQKTYTPGSLREMRTYMMFSNRSLLSSKITCDRIVIRRARCSHPPTANDLEEVIRWYENGGNTL